ncbi:MAG TPA: ATP-binding protein [Longimicrobium sp.]|nr:ATP-binding protein [Longimicrobium sp.]
MLRTDSDSRRGEERYRAFVEQSSEGIWCFEFDPPVPLDVPVDEQIEHAYRHGVLLECNDAMARMYGFQRAAELVGTRLVDFLPPADPANVEYLRTFLDTGHRLRDAETRELDRDGNERVFANNLVAIQEGGTIPRVWGTQRDITEQKRLEAQLIAARREAERARQRTDLLNEAGAILASTLDFDATLAAVARLAVPVFAEACIVDVVDAQGEVARVEAIHLDPTKQALLRELRRRYPPRPGDPDPTLEAIATRRPVTVRDVPDETLRASARNEQHLRLLRAVRPRSGIVVPMLARGEALGALTFVRYGGEEYAAADVPFAQELARRAALALDHSRLYREALAANQAKADFLATMSHELRTPLNAVLGYAELLLMGIPVPVAPESQEHVHRIRRATRHLISIIEEILVFSRMEAGRETLALAPVELAELVREVAAIAEPLAGDKRIRFRTCEPPEGEVVTDGRKLRQILINLLGNAVKFTDRGEVSFLVEREPGEVRFRVADTGVGIAPEYLEQIWEPFRQVQDPMTRTAGGTGLGLSVSRHLARLLGAELTVKSVPGEGSAFTLRLPVS